MTGKGRHDGKTLPTRIATSKPSTAAEEILRCLAAQAAALDDADEGRHLVQEVHHRRLDDS
jgi:hypothetical protein